MPVYYLIAPSEASANLARYDGVKYGFSVHDAGSMWEEMEQTRGRGFGDEVKRRIMLGTYALSTGYYDAYYLKAQKVRTVIRRDFEQALSDPALLSPPTTPTPTPTPTPTLAPPTHPPDDDEYTRARHHASPTC